MTTSGMVLRYINLQKRFYSQEIARNVLNTLEKKATVDYNFVKSISRNFNLTDKDYNI